MSEATASITPSLTALLSASVSNWVRANLWAGFRVGRIHTYDSVKRTATVELLIGEVEELPDGDRRVDHPIIHNVPVLMLGRDGAFFKWTPQAGDHLLVQFGSRSIDKFMTVGDKVDPDDPRTYAIDDAVAIPVARFDFQHVADADPQIEHTGSEIHIGGIAPLALNADLNTVIAKVNTIISQYNLHTHPVSGALAGITTFTVAGAVATMTGTQKVKGG